MLRFYFIFCFSFILSYSFSQEEPTRSTIEPIANELSKWDVIRGPWLAASLEAVANDKPIPVRTFPENFTPNQMLRMVDNDTRNNVRATVNENRLNSDNPGFWNKVSRSIESTYCTPKQGRSYGDPHMVSYDGARFSFQTVGEFVLTKSKDGKVEVQTRQKPQNEDFSLNTAVAMNVAGDRLAIYADDYPDADYSTPVRLNGKALHLTGSTYFLEHGGTIKKTKNSYMIHWPNGESAKIDHNKSVNMPFLNVTVSILPCIVTEYTGVLGNANGYERDDFDPGFIIPFEGQADPFDDDNYYNRVRQAQIAKAIAENNRVTDFNTLFDYAMGRNTMYFTDPSFPRIHRTINDLNNRDRDLARKRCEQNGVSPRDLNACIFDNAFLDIEPTREPILNDPVVETRELRKIEREVINRNPSSTSSPRDVNEELKKEPAIRTNPKPRETQEHNNEHINRPDIQNRPNKPVTNKPVVKEPAHKPVVKPTPKPKPKPTVDPVRKKPVVKPRPTSNPKPKPTPKPVAKPKPTQKSSSSGGIRKGGR